MIDYCDQHDVPLTEYGCWACGHGGPITDPAADSWDRWVLGSTTRAYERRASA